MKSRKVVGLLLLVFTVEFEHSAAQGKDFVLPKGAETSLWEAENAGLAGNWEKIKHPWASEGGYVKPKLVSGKTLLEFPFSVRKTTTIAIYPVWWQHGERNPAKYFPYPLPREMTPSVVDYYKNLIYFSAPAAGKVGVFDAYSETFLPPLEVGGYVSDLIVNRDIKKLYVADAQNNKILAFDPQEKKKTGEFNVPAAPWSVALGKDRLYVACREGKSIAVIDTSENKLLRELSVPFEPVNVEIRVNRMVVRAMPKTFNADTFQEIASPLEFYALQGRHTVCFSTSRLKGKDFFCARTHLLGVGEKGIDLKSVTDSGKIAEDFSYPFKDYPGPDVIDIYENFIFFSSPATGKVGILDAESEEIVNSISIGGYISDMLVNQDEAKVYVADASGNCIVVVDADKQTLLSKIKVPQLPWSLFLRKEKLFVACRKDKAIAIIDTTMGKITREIPLASEPTGVQFLAGSEYVRAPGSGQRYKQPTLVVTLAPLVFDTRTFEKLEVGASDEFRERSSIAYEGSLVSVGVNGSLTMCAGGKWFDVTEICEPALYPQRPLGSGDSPGTITFSIDKGAEYDWMRDVWITPEHGLYLVNGTERFWRYNAPRFNLRPGKHVLRVRAYNSFAQIDGLRIRRTLEDTVKVKILPQPEDIRGKRSALSCQGVFYYNEPIRFRTEVLSKTSLPKKVSLNYEVYNYLDELRISKERKVRLTPGEPWEEVITFGLSDYGRHKIRLFLESSDGSLVKERWFLRLPKLEYPRLFFRKDEIPEIKARIAKYPQVFQRFNWWLREKCLEKNFLPKSLAVADCGHRSNHFAWRLIACEFASRFLNPKDDAFFKEKLVPLFMKKSPDTPYGTLSMFHYHGSLFPGAEVSFHDMEAMDDPEMRAEIQKLFGGSAGNMALLPWAILSYEEPLTAQERAILSRVMMWETNVENYFLTHCGTRGGTRWLNWRTGCGCPTRAWTLVFLYLSKFFGEKRLFEQKHFSGYLTYHDYLIHGLPASYRKDLSGVGPDTIKGHPLHACGRWVGAGLSRHPIDMKVGYGWWDQIVKELEKDELADSQIKGIFSRRGPAYRYLRETLGGEGDEAMCMPIALALGWYQPSSPNRIDWEELPPTTIFDAEGDVSMRSDWGPQATQIYFHCGIHDMNRRDQPTDFQITKSDRLLFGTGSFGYDDGNVTPSWGNVVTIGSKWQKIWAGGKYLLREDNKVINLNWSPMGRNARYNSRDIQLFGYHPATGGMTVPKIGFHSHWPHFFVKQAKIVAYETWPEFDYVAGDATNVWPAEDVSEIYRQLVFIKPSVVIVYDRVKLQRDGIENYWLATTAKNLAVEGNKFHIKNKPALLKGEVLLPRQSSVHSKDPVTSPRYEYWFKRGAGSEQRILEIKPTSSDRNIRYLVVMKMGEETEPITLEPRLVSGKALVGTELVAEGRKVEVLFRRDGPVGGHITISGGKTSIDHEFVQKIDDSYHHWSEDPRFQKWMKESRFSFVILEQDRKKFGEANVRSPHTGGGYSGPGQR